MTLRKIEDFVCPTLQVLEELGGEASLKEIEEGFYRRFSGLLDPSKDWNQVTPNHGRELWRDYCGSRVAYQHLRPAGYVTLEQRPGKGSTYKLTEQSLNSAGVRPISNQIKVSAGFGARHGYPVLSLPVTVYRESAWSLLS